MAFKAGPVLLIKSSPLFGFGLPRQYLSQVAKQLVGVDNILEQLDLNPLPIILLATVARHNKWDSNRGTRKSENQQTAVLRTGHKMSLAAAIEP